MIDDVIANVRDEFLDEGVDEQVLQEMKQIWTNKLVASKAVEAAPDPTQSQPPPLVSGTSKVNGTKSKKATINNEIKSNVNASMNGNQQPKNLSNPPALLQSSQVLPTASSSLNATKMSQQSQSSNFQQMKTEPGTQQPTVVNQQPPQSSQASALQQSAQRITLDPNKLIPIQITLPPQPGTSNSTQRVLTIQVPASAIQENQVSLLFILLDFILNIMNFVPATTSVDRQHHYQHHAFVTGCCVNCLTTTCQFSVEQHECF